MVEIGSCNGGAWNGGMVRTHGGLVGGAVVEMHGGMVKGTRMVVSLGG